MRFVSRTATVSEVNHALKAMDLAVLKPTLW